MNVVVLVGRIASEIELKYTPAGKAVCQFRLAVDSGTKNADGEKSADFFSVVCWEKTAENVAQYCEKGRLIAASGRLQSRSYEAQDGSKRHVVEVVANNVRFLEKRQDAPHPNDPQFDGEPL